MDEITAKVTCNLKEEYGEGEHRATRLGFCPDYADGRNKAWAAATPALSLQMTVKGAVGDHFAPGQNYTLTFAPENS